MRRTFLVFALLLAFPALAQQSASYKLEEHVFNTGGHPLNGTVLTSTSYRVSLDAVGDAAVETGLSSASYRMDGSFGSCYPPPGEVHGLWFSDRQTLNWQPEKSVDNYNLYRDLVSNLSGLGYGACEQYDLEDETAMDGDDPPVGDGYFYLVTAENRLDEEGTKGKDSDDTNRRGNACP